MINYSKCKQKNDEQAPIYVQPVHRLSFKKRSSLLIHLGSQLFDVVGSNVLVIFHHLVDDTIRSQFNHTISNGLNKFVVMRREEDITFVSLQIVIECLNRLQVEMIGRSIENQTVGICLLYTSPSPRD